jgi:ribosomal-protein-alanine N-acetyltransferase
VVEIGYSIVPAYRSHGYATEAAQGLIKWLWTQNVPHITAGCDADNVGSIRVLEKLCMRRTGQEGNELRWELKQQ